MSATTTLPLAAPARPRGFARFVVSVTCAFAGVWLALPLSAVLLAGRGASAAAVGAFAAVVWGAALVAAPLAPLLAARLGGPLALHRAGAAATALALAALPLAGDAMPAWLALGALVGAASSLAWTGSDATALAFAPPGGEGRAIGLYQTFVSAAIGAGPLVLLGLGARIEALWAATAIIAVGLAVGAPLPEPRGAIPRRRPSAARLRVLLAALPAAAAAAVLSGGVEGIEGSILPVQGLALGLGPTTAGLLAAAAGLGNLASQYAVGVAVDRVGPRRATRACAATAALAAGLWPLAADTPAMWAVLALFGGAGGAFYTLGMVSAAARLAGPGRTVVVSGLNTAYLLGGALGAPAAGLLLHAAPAALPWALAAVLLGAGLGVARGLR
jgi:predicted MFS family arabinose efflux permease